MYRGKKPLQTLKAVLALDLDYLVFVSSSCLKPPACNECGIVGDIFLKYELQTGFRDQPLVHSARHEEKKADRAAERQFIVRHRARDYDWIGEDRPPTPAKDAIPFPEHRKSIGQMIHGVNAD